MKTLLLPGLDPYEHLAMEECLLEQRFGRDSLFLLYRNRPSVVIGSFQNTHAETDAALLCRRNVALARRISGGGSVYHDPGNLCWAFLLPAQQPEAIRLGEFLLPLEQALCRLGIPVERSLRNDLLLFGKKVSGSAARILRDRLLLHGTLLYDADLSALHGLLQGETGLVETRAARSVPSPVANIRQEANLGWSTEEFLQRLAETMCPEGAWERLEPELIACAQKLAERKYRAWEWTFGRNPACVMQIGAQGRRLRLWLNHERVERIQDPAGVPALNAMMGMALPDAMAWLEHNGQFVKFM